MKFRKAVTDQNIERFLLLLLLISYEYKKQETENRMFLPVIIFQNKAIFKINLWYSNKEHILNSLFIPEKRYKCIMIKKSNAKFLSQNLRK